MSSERQRPRRLASAALLFALMVLGSLGMWIGLPLLWLVLAGQVQGATGSLSAAIGAALLGLVLSIVLAVRLLHWIARMHNAARTARGLEDLGWAPLEGVMAVSAIVAIVAFIAWFVLFAGAEPLPLGLPK
ncbi:MAG: hypothetical protein QOG63_2086 [Thermoleophilaceae bacterium]|nr:hypothetical protein [Thermoleophilaceae bacterium]